MLTITPWKKNGIKIREDERGGGGGGQSIWADKTGFAWDKVISSNMNMRKT